MRISEIFYSIQGEGRLAGIPSVFIRTTGCNLRCRWCDTPYTSWEPEGDDQTLDAVISRTRAYPASHVVVTGGEPMLDRSLPELCRRLRELESHITIETAGTVLQDEIDCDLMSISPKLSNSTPWRRDAAWAQRHERLRINVETLRGLMDRFEYQLKFVMDCPEDVDEVEELLGQVGRYDPSNVLLMPQGVSMAEIESRREWIADACKQRGFRYGPRLHIELYGNQRGT